MTQQSRQPLSAASTRIVDLVHTQFRRARSLTTSKQTNEQARQLAKNELTRNQTKAVERILLLIADAVQRGAPLEEVETVPLLLLAQAREEYATKHGAPLAISRADAHQMEEEAEGEMEEAETAYAYNPSIANATRLLIAQAKHRRMVEQFGQVVRRDLVAG